MQLKMPWVDTRRCRKELECRAALLCKIGAFKEGEPGPEGTSKDFPKVDLEACKRCGDCEHACPYGAVKMI